MESLLPDSAADLPVGFAVTLHAMRWPTCVFLLLLIAQLASCAATAPTAEDPLEIAPADFYIDATVLATPASRSPDAAKAIYQAPAHLRPARYVVFADGTLRHAFESEVNKGANWLPPISRMLTREQIAETWALAHQLGLTRDDSGDPLINPSLVKADPGQRLVYVDFRGHGKRWNFIRAAPLDQPCDAAVATLIKHLVELSWADQMPPPDAMITPKRYDFGPDPYERYRQPKQP